MKNFEGCVLTGIFNGIIIELAFIVAIVFIIKLF